MTPKVLFFCFYFFLLNSYLFYSHIPYWQILILLPKFPLTFIKTPKGIPLSIAQLMTILVLIWMVFVIIWEILHGKISLNLVLLLLHVSGSRLKLMYISLNVNMRLHLVHLLATFFNICLKESLFQIVGRSHLLFLYLRMLREVYN